MYKGKEKEKKDKTRMLGNGVLQFSFCSQVVQMCLAESISFSCYVSKLVEGVLVFIDRKIETLD